MFSVREETSPLIPPVWIREIDDVIAGHGTRRKDDKIIQKRERERERAVVKERHTHDAVADDCWNRSELCSTAE